jgi:tetratricopeptide (TPR) repeat protein
MRMAAADGQFRAGCLDCLEQALDQYLALRSDARIGRSATESAIRTALLIAVRENELGLLDSGHIQQARGLVQELSPALSVSLDVADALSTKPSGVSRSPFNDAESRAVTRISRTQQEWASALRQLMPDDLTADYLWLGLACGPYGFDVPDRNERTTLLGASLETPLIRFKTASSCSIQRPAMQTLLDGEPRFVEANYFIGVSALSAQLRVGAFVGTPDVDEAETRFQTAYTWHSNWPALTMAIANLALTAEDFERAIDFYNRTLALVANHPEALLGSIRAFTYAGQHADAIVAADRLLAANRNPGEARYWRALNEEQLQQHDAAWVDVERAAEAMVSPDVPKLAGIIAINRRELDVARQRLESSLSARPSDCETAFYLQAVLTQQRLWGDAARVASDAAGCLDGEIARLANEITALEASEMRADRRDRQIAKRQQQISSETRMRASSWFDAAAANFNLTRRDDAKRFAEKLLDDEQYRDRARDLLARLSAQ